MSVQEPAGYKGPPRPMPQQSSPRLRSLELAVSWLGAAIGSQAGKTFEGAKSPFEQPLSKGRRIDVESLAPEGKVSLLPKKES